MAIMRFNTRRLVPTILNVAGLVLAFSVFMILSVQISYDTGYDLRYPGHENIVRLEYSDPTNPGRYEVQFSRPFIEYLKQGIPQTEAVACYRYYKNATEELREAGTDNPGVQLRFAQADYDLLRVFPFDFISGDTSEFRMPLTAVISEKGARKLFGMQSPVGREVQGCNPGSESYRIVAVYRDFPSNTSVDNEIIFNIGEHNLGNWSEWSFPCYMKLSVREGVDVALDTLKNVLYGEEFSGKVGLRVSGLHEAYYSRDVVGDNMAKGNRAMTLTLLSISVMVLAIAVINFINFAMASVPFTIRSINTRMVLGSTRARQIWRQLSGAFVLVMSSFALSILVMSFVSKSQYASYISGSLKVSDNLPLIVIGACVAAVTAFLAGILPARYSTSFNPAMVLKGSFSLSGSGRRLRTVLVGFQYVVSFILIICSLFISVQIRYMKSYDMGFEKESILEFSVSDKIGENRETFRQMLMENPDILDVTFSANYLVSNNKMGWGRDYQGEHVQMDCLPVDRNFISFFGMEVVEGRDFSESDDRSTSGTFIVNEAFMEKYPFLRLGLKFIGHRYNDPAEIVGIVRDFNFKPLRYGITPLVLYNFGSDPWWPLTVGYAKINPMKVKDVMADIRTKCAEMDPSLDASSLEILFMDEGIGMWYMAEERLSRLITSASVISLLISVIGILGLVYFETQFRRKEIALRRVHGAQIGGILMMLNRYYLIIMLCCFAIAVPVAVTIIREWVSGFTYQSPVPLWIFAAAFAAVGLITVVTVTFQSRRTAMRNPSDSLRTE